MPVYVPVLDYHCLCPLVSLSLSTCVPVCLCPVSLPVRLCPCPCPSLSAVSLYHCLYPSVFLSLSLSVSVPVPVCSCPSPCLHSCPWPRVNIALLFQCTFLETDNFQILFRMENLERVIEINRLNDREHWETREILQIDGEEREREVERLKKVDRWRYYIQKINRWRARKRDTWTDRDRYTAVWPPGKREGVGRYWG